MSSFSECRRRTLEGIRDLIRYLYSDNLLAVCPSVANAVYDRLPHSWLKFLIGHGVFRCPPRNFEWTVSLANGQQIKIEVSPEDRFSFECAIEYKAHDVGLKRTLEFFLDRCGQRSLYLDIGANIGVSSLYALAIGHDCWLFEPNEDLHRFGSSLFALNHFNKARWEPVALAEAEGEDRFYVSQSSFLSSFDADHAALDGAVKEIIVKKNTLDSYLEQIKKVADELVIKIDVEGHELQVLNGAKSVFAAFRPPVQIELLRSEKARSTAWDFFQSLNYVCFGIFDEPQLHIQQLATAGELVAFPEINFTFLPSEHSLRRDLERHS